MGKVLCIRENSHSMSSVYVSHRYPETSPCLVFKTGSQNSKLLEEVHVIYSLNFEKHFSLMQKCIFLIIIFLVLPAPR
jgi:hypothetical protein